jgi:hypothetical protein
MRIVGGLERARLFSRAAKSGKLSGAFRRWGDSSVQEMSFFAACLALRSRIDLRYFGHLPCIRNRFNATTLPLESSCTLVP